MIYVSFPLWTPELLEEQQAAKAEAEKKWAEFNVEKNEHLRAYGETDNILMKAIHYRNAAAAYEKLDLSAVQYYQHIPSIGDDIVTIHDGLFASSKGNVFSISPGMFKKKALLGEAFIHQPKEEVNDDQQNDIRAARSGGTATATATSTSTRLRP